MLSASPSARSNVAVDARLATPRDSRSGGYRLEEVPDPEPGPGRGTCPAPDRPPSTTSISGYPAACPAPHSFPHVAGADGAGMVEAIGAGVERWPSATRW